jgi:hypothetical protein
VISSAIKKKSESSPVMVTEIALHVDSWGLRDDLSPSSDRVAEGFPP